MSPRLPRDATTQPVADRAASAADLLAELMAIVIIAAQLTSGIGRVGQIAGFAALVGLIIVKRTRMARLIGPLWLLLFPAFAVLSTIWSPSSSITLSYSLQLLVTLASGLVIAVSVGLRGFVRVLFWSALLVCVASLAIGTKGPSAEGPVLIGLLGSKNNMAACAHLAFVAALGLCFDSRQPGFQRIAAILSLPISLLIIAQSHAASMIGLSAASVLLLLLIWGISRLPRQGKLFGLALIVAATPLLAATVPPMAAAGEDYFMTTFKKDRTLTGRTYLWTVAEESIRQRPVLGWGYKYLWMSYSPAAVGMLRSQKVKDARTFSMHQTYLEAAADLGLVGLAILLLTFAVGSGAVMWIAVTEGGMPNIFSAVMVTNLIARSLTETIFGPFYAYGTILLALFAYALFKRLRVPISESAPPLPNQPASAMRPPSYGRGSSWRKARR